MTTDNLDPACLVVVLLNRCLDGTGFTEAHDIREKFAHAHPEVCSTCREYRVPTAEAQHVF